MQERTLITWLNAIKIAQIIYVDMKKSCHVFGLVF